MGSREEGGRPGHAVEHVRAGAGTVQGRVPEADAHAQVSDAAQAVEVSRSKSSATCRRKSPKGGELSRTVSAEAIACRMPQPISRWSRCEMLLWSAGSSLRCLFV